MGFAHAKCFLYNTSAQWFGPDVTCKRNHHHHLDDSDDLLENDDLDDSDGD